MLITAPAPGAMVGAGQALDVEVSPGTVPVSSLLIFVSDVGISDPLTVPPYRWTFNIPERICGRKRITAVGVKAGGAVYSPSVEVEVDLSFPIVRLLAEPASFEMSRLGEQLTLTVEGFLGGQGRTNLRGCRTLNVTSMNTNVAVIDSAGLVTATGSGSTELVVTEGNLRLTVPVKVTEGPRGDLDGDGVIDRYDLDILNSSLNRPSVRPVDSRDLNRDGVINALDARILVTLCTRAGCAVQ